MACQKPAVSCVGVNSLGFALLTPPNIPRPLGSNGPQILASFNRSRGRPGKHRIYSHAMGMIPKSTIRDLGRIWPSISNQGATLQVISDNNAT